MEVFVVKDVVVSHILLNDETAAATFSITKEHAGTVRREMRMIPRWSVQLSDHGRLVSPDVMKAYLDYRGSREWEKEIKSYKKKRRAS